MDSHPSSHTGSAAAHVFGITELLEKIIMQLPTRNILTCQRVCRHFRDTVQGSICIRQLLLLEPPTGSLNLTTTPWRLPSCDQQLSCTDHIHVNPLFKGRRPPDPLKYMFICHDTYAKHYYIELWIKNTKQHYLEHGSWRQVYGSNVPLKVKVFRESGEKYEYKEYESMRLGEAVERFVADSAAGNSQVVGGW
ncbi:hypothetical protein HII31_08055 [Pseudocercospora fuligena]|uniref:F-box domain-containing protein n=1 Tax=Pseudocercospora fuligena TaxID=685502 RepID=A0A8H6RIY7_9PEZI|nr:hypothetical protein HII31_08055 [Pseudocercospora fuligena]